MRFSNRAVRAALGGVAVVVAILVTAAGVSAAGAKGAHRPAAGHGPSLLPASPFARLSPASPFLLFGASVGASAGFEDADADLDPGSMTDWNSFAPTTWSGTAPYQGATETSGPWTFYAMSDATATTSDTGFAGGTKEDDVCPAVIGSKAPNKDDLARVYLAGETLNGHVYLMLAWVRIPQHSTSSDEHVAFEFDQGTSSCGGGSPLVQRTAGDLLVVYDFTSGGTPTFSISKWVTTGTCEVGSDSPPCWGPQQTIAAAEGAVNTAGSVTDAISPTSPTPVTLGTNEFGEAGIDLTAATVNLSGGRPCERFGTALANSRSSGSSSTAQMEDLVGPLHVDLSNCATPSLSTTPNPAGGGLGTSLNDTAHLSGGNGPTGTVTFDLYGPNDPSCAGPALYTESDNLSGHDAATTGGPPAATAGTYHWMASYGGDGNNNPAASGCADEAVTIVKSSPTISTVPNPGAGALGAALNDTAHVSGGSNPTGTVTFSLYGPSDPMCSSSAIYTETVGLSGGGAATTGSPTASNAGTYHWRATYNGDNANNAASSACADEAVTIAKVSPTIATSLSTSGATAGDTVHDSATLTGASTHAGGTVTYTVYTDNACTVDARDAGTKAVTNGTVADSDGLRFDSVGTYYWQAVYSGDGNDNPATSHCTSEVLTVHKASPSIATTLSETTGAIGDSVHDSATLTGATANAGGTVTYTVYANNACTSGARDAGTKPVTNAAVGDSDALPFASAGTYYWQAVYSGDGNNDPTTSSCHSEILTIGKDRPTIATTLSETTGAVGDTVHDSATLTGASADAGGTVTYTVYSDGACTTDARAAGTKPVTNGAVADSDGLPFPSAGTYYWQAVYSGDSNNVGATSACHSEVLTIAKNKPSISTALSATTGAVDDTVNDSATLTGATAGAGGTVTYTVYTDDSCSAGARAAGVKPVRNGVVGDSDALSFDTAGTYYWQAAYSGDSNNEAATSPCKSEILTIGKKSPSISTALSATTGAVGDTVHDSGALVGASANAGGTVTYTVYTDDACTTGARSAGTKPVTNGSVADSDGLVFDSAGTYYWQAVYSGDANNGGATSPCKSEILTIEKNTPSLATTLSASTGAVGDTVHDSATLTGATANAGGTVTYTVYTNDTCTTGARDGGTKPVTNGSVGDSDGLPFATAGTYYWQAAYSGDSNNEAATSPCRSEVLTIAKNSPSIATTLSAATVDVGATVHDSATLSGGTADAGGTVAYTVYSNSTCTADARDAGTKAVTNGAVVDSDGLVFATPGAFYWQAAYSGDANNKPATSACTEEQLSVERPAIAIVKNPNSQTIGAGGTASFSITVTNTGTVTLTNVTVTDALSPDCAKTIGTLEPTQSNSYTCSLAGVSSSFTNSATATGHPPLGPDVTATDTADVIVTPTPPPPPPTTPTPPAPKIDLAIVKNATPASSALGDRVTWTLTITNNGPDDATGVTVADPIPAGMRYVSSTSAQGICTGGAMLSCQLGSMKSGASVVVTLVTASSATGTITNTATVVGNESETNTANNTASANVQVHGAFVPPVPVCTAVGVTPRQLLVGHRSRLTMRVTQKGKGVHGVRVRIHGSTLSIVTAPSNGRGIVKRSVRPSRPGIVVFRPVAHKGCRVTRIGVIGVFTPPLTG